MLESSQAGPPPLAVVTGAGSGIGRAVAEGLAGQGWTVHGLDRRDAAGGMGVQCHRGDVTSIADLEAVRDRLDGAAVDALVCAAGIWDPTSDSRFDRLDLAVWEQTLAVNLTGTMLALRAFYPALSDPSSVVTFGSIAGLVGFPNRDAYTASKGAVIALTRAWAVELAPVRIRVNCVCPGVTRTPMTEAALATQALGLPGGRPAEAAEIADVVAFLCSRESTFLSGAVIPVDAGFTAAPAGMPFAPPRQRNRGGDA